MLDDRARGRLNGTEFPSNHLVNYVYSKSVQNNEECRSVL